MEKNEQVIMPAIKNTNRTSGPKTARGKARSALNATTHGLTATVIPPQELAAFRRHHAAIIEDLAPVGYLEEALADRVAHALWRLRRIQAFEATALGRRHVEVQEYLIKSGVSSGWERGGADLDELPCEQMSIRQVARAIAAIVGGSPEPYLRDPAMLRTLAERNGARAGALEGLPVEPCVDALERLPVDVRILLRRQFVVSLLQLGMTANAIAKAATGRKPTKEDTAMLFSTSDELGAQALAGVWGFAERRGLQGLPHHLASELAEIGHRSGLLHNRLIDLIEQEQSTVLFIDPVLMEKLQRYEAHLQRGFYRALHELEALQLRRAGKEAPLARLEVAVGSSTETDGCL